MDLDTPQGQIVGDRTSNYAAADYQAICLANTLFNDRPMAPVHEAVPAAVFSQPPLGTVGLTESEARARYGEIDVYRASFRALKQTLTSSETRCLAKLVVDRGSDRVVGLHMAGHEAGEIVQGFAVAVRAGLTKAQFDEALQLDPEEGEFEALYGWAYYLAHPDLENAASKAEAHLENALKLSPNLRRPTEVPKGMSAAEAEQEKLNKIMEIALKGDGTANLSLIHI